MPTRRRQFAALCLAVLALAGCRKPLLAPDERRTQYDSYDHIRNQHAQQYVEDAFGERKPNLRGRLAPKR
jgi:hypothetical protein